VKFFSYNPLFVSFFINLNSEKIFLKRAIVSKLGMAGMAEVWVLIIIHKRLNYADLISDDFV
jgi:hypothetical protein